MVKLKNDKKIKKPRTELKNKKGWNWKQIKILQKDQEQKLE